jgi:ankyrin repeat protein
LLPAFLLPGIGFAAAPPALSTRELIDRLQLVRESDYGYIPTVNGRIFLPLDREGTFEGGMLFQPPPVPSQTMRELVRRGVAAVPLLVTHLTDARPTRLIIRGGFGAFMIEGKGFSRWDAIHHPLGDSDQPASYTLTVGDLCYVALGQIVNRYHTVVSYIPSGNVFVAPVAARPEEVAKLRREWGRLTPALHKASLLRDARRALEEREQISACKRLAYYYPDALEQLALQLLAIPTWNDEGVSEFIEEQLDTAKDAKERRQRFNAFVAKHGKPGREVLLRLLFYNLKEEEQSDERNAARRLLVELFGYGPKVRVADRPDFMNAIGPYEKARLIRQALIYDSSKKIDQVVRNLLVSTKDDFLARACMDRLVGRGYDADIERYCKRRIPALEGWDKEELQAALDRLGWTPLHVAAARGQLDRVPALLAAGHRPDDRARNGDTPLHLAVRGGDEPLLRLLLSHKPKLDGKDRAGLTAAQLAARADEDSLVLLLLKHGCAIPDIRVAAIAGRADLVARFLKADPTSLQAKSDADRTPLHLAARHGRTEAVRILLEHKADSNASLDSGWRPLHAAAQEGHAAVARLLLLHRASPDARLKEDKLTPLHLAAHNGHLEVVRLLLEKGAGLDLADKQKRSALYHAVHAGHEAIARLLLKHKANPRGAEKDAPCPLHAAAAAGRATLVKLLLDAGADPEIRDRDTGETALHQAAHEGRSEVARLLLNRGARIDRRDQRGKTALYHAVAQDREEMVQLLLKHKADPNVATETGVTPLHVAAWYGRTKLARLLLAHKANPNAPIRGGLNTGSTALHLAAQGGHLDMVQLLLAHKANLHARTSFGETVLHAAARSGRVEVARLLLEKGVPVDGATDNGLTALHFAAQAAEGAEATVKLLLRHKANVRAATKDGWEPLCQAAEANNTEVVALLLDHKADVNVREKEEGRTPLHLGIEGPMAALIPNEAKALAVVRLLLRHKADVTVKDDKGRTPLALAGEMKYEEVSELLRKYGAKK